MSFFVDIRALDRRCWALAAARLVVTAGFSMVMPFLAMYLAVDRGVPAVTIGFIWATAGALGAVCQWLAGELADRLGRRPIMLAAMLLRAANLAAMGWAVMVDAPIAVLGVLTVGNGVLRAFFDPVATAMVADLSAPDARVAAYSLQRVGINVGWALGPALAGILTDVSYAWLFFASAPLTLAAAATIWPIREVTSTRARRPFSGAELFAWRDDRRLRVFLLATVALFLLQVQLYQSLSIYSARHLGLGRAEVGTLYTLNGLLVVLLQLPAARFISRLGTSRALVLGCFLYAASYAAVGLAGGHIGLLACVAAITLAEIVTAPAQQAAITALAPEGRVGAYTGLFGLAQVVGQSSGPLLGTALLDGLPARAAWFVLACSGLLAATWYRAVARSR